MGETFIYSYEVSLFDLIYTFFGTSFSCLFESAFVGFIFRSLSISLSKMMGRNFLAVALCTLCIFSCITQNAEATQLVYFSDSCGSARAADLNLTPAEVGYVGPAPATGFQLCVIDRTRIIMCTDLNATINTVTAATCALPASAV